MSQKGKKLLNLNTQGSGKVGGGPSKKILENEKKHESHIQELEVKAFDHNNEQGKEGKKNDVPELVSINPGKVGNPIGAKFWDNK